ncbi:hypothetical protein E2986_11091 [Frieseomelitta varia]|uniref:Uncharacterized protein n=1 Tax=Frieseomelitta varia TaxID=561572 RepID=A0A833RNK4_9HYME|nr:hypothetical protein E2986_11091 [Frieseomelitta varia]
MSVYSMDSLENFGEISPRNQNFLYRNTDGFNLEPNTGSNETTSSINKDTGTAGSKNAIIANRGLVDTSKQRCPTSSGSGKRNVADPLKRNNTNGSKREEDDGSKRQVVDTSCTKRFSKTSATKCCSKDVPMSMKPNKKLGNVLAPKVQQARKPRSYLELYRRRFSGPQYKARSPEGSTLSVCGDSEREELTDDDTRSLATPRDDQSELSFYRRIIEGSTDPLASANRSAKTVRRPTFQDTNTIFSSSNTAKYSAPDDKSKKSLGYKPYTIEEYKTLPIPKLDRSLGPDKIEMQAKLIEDMEREQLILSDKQFYEEQGMMLSRIVSEIYYKKKKKSDGVARAANALKKIGSNVVPPGQHSGWRAGTASTAARRQAHDEEIVVADVLGDTTRDAVAEKCFLPPLKDQEVDAKMQDDSMCSTIIEDRGSTIQTHSDTNGGRYSKKNICKTHGLLIPR